MRVKAPVAVASRPASSPAGGAARAGGAPRSSSSPLASVIAREFLRDDAQNLRLLGQPYVAVVPSSIRTAEDGSVHLELDGDELVGSWTTERLQRALERLPKLLAEQGRPPRTVAAFHRRFVPRVF